MGAVPLHGCKRKPLDQCPEEEFLVDVMRFLQSTNRGRLVPSSSPLAFPAVNFNGSRLDLFNLYREVVSRGGYNVRNGINWKGQIFPSLRNHTNVNKATAVSAVLKRHYEVYLLDYEQAHNDVGGEACIICKGGSLGDWVNCGACGAWAHFDCDRRSGLGTFKEYVRIGGREYVCPRCSTGSEASRRRG
eukprot:TRINITY_DN39352_c0_g1_i1.p1 TRINITY_DN39352_c0_g1~~TRINITY_DN39352_c0_g1_i1.p1  ORF type:complete len:220 (-),score=37.89 TRINITY_DN39352_c0_g1_i1:647-1213(-)